MSSNNYCMINIPDIFNQLIQCNMLTDIIKNIEFFYFLLLWHIITTTLITFVYTFINHDIMKNIILSLYHFIHNPMNIYEVI